MDTGLRYEDVVATNLLIGFGWAFDIYCFVVGALRGVDGLKNPAHRRTPIHLLNRPYYIHSHPHPPFY